MVREVEPPASNEVEHSHVPVWLQAMIWRAAVAALGVKLEVKGHIDPSIETALIAVAPHSGHLDTIKVLLGLNANQRADQVITVAKNTYFGVGQGWPRVALSMLNPAWYSLSKTTGGLKKLMSTVETYQRDKLRKLFLLFPQGTRDNPEEQPLDMGVARLAWRSGTPIVPVILGKGEEWTLPKGMSIREGIGVGVRRMLTGRRSAESVHIGQPIDTIQLLGESPVQTPKAHDAIVMQALVQGYLKLYDELGHQAPQYILSMLQSMPGGD